VEDASDQPLVGSQLRASLAREAVDQAGEGLAPRGSARGLLTARVLTVEETTVAFAAPDRPREYLLRAEAEATLTRPDGRVLWKSTRIHADREFISGLTVEATQRNKEVAVEQLARDLSREILRRVALTMDREPRP
jgi:outer membrane lipopolysaccharide assembly protein LptE/RlpB